MRTLLVLVLLLLGSFTLPAAQAVRECGPVFHACAGTGSSSQGDRCEAGGTGSTTDFVYANYAILQQVGGFILFYKCESDDGVRASEVRLMLVLHPPPVARTEANVEWGREAPGDPCTIRAASTGAIVLTHESACVLAGPPVIVGPPFP